MLPTGHVPQTATPLVGRSGELARLTALLAEAQAGQPVVVLISGDAGVGKTRVVTELAAVAAGRGFTVLSGRCAELADTVPYLPLADALRDAASGPSARGPVLDALATRPVLSRLLPDQPFSQPGGDLPGLAQQQLFGAVLGLLAELAGTGPVLLILEDLHWADRSTRDLVTFLSRVLHRERIALVLTYRTDDLHRRHPLRPVVAELLRLPSVSAVDLRPLDPAAMAEHLVALSGGLLAAPVLDHLIGRAEGNAYYAEELLAASPDLQQPGPESAGHDSPARGSLAGDSAAGLPREAALPSGLADLLLARMERLSPDAQQALRAAAVAGRHVDDELVTRASGLAARDYEAAVREAVAQQLLVPDGDRGLAFRHALLREAIYADLLPGERTRLHAQLAELLADPRRLAEVPGSAAELAHHCLASHDVPGAFAASVLAGQEAERLTAPAEAHRHYDLALSLWDRVSDPATLGGIERGDLALRSALSAADAGDIARAVQQLRRMVGYLGADADPVLLSRVSERLAYFLMEVDEEGAALVAARAAVDALPADPPSSERARALATLARTLLVQQDAGPSLDIARQARAAGRAAGAPWVVADALVTLGLLAERGGRVRTAIASFDRALAQARAAGVLGVELRAAFQLARIYLERGSLAEASNLAHEAFRRASDAGLAMAPYGFDLQYLHYLAHFADGDWDHAQQIADGFASRVASEAEARLSAMALFLEVARGSDNVAQRRAWLEPFLPRDYFTEYIARGQLAEHAYWQGDAAAAAAQSEATVRAAIAWEGPAAPQLIRVAAGWLSVLADQAVRARAGGETDHARALAGEASRVVQFARDGASNRGRPLAALGVDGRGWLARAEAEWLRATGDNDPAAWQAVLDAFGPGFVYEAARSRWRLAEALAEAGRREEAQRQWELAVAAAEELGAAPLRRVLADLGRRARLTGPPAGGGPGHAEVTGLGALTSREVEVLRLLVAGQSNREIASALYIAPKTASVHVSNILAKLGAASRTEAAAIAHGHGLSPVSNGRLPG